MSYKKNKIIMHIDVNSAFLSWQAAYNKQIGIETDIRDIPAVVGGNQATRHGIVLAKSLPAKKLGIKTGESLMEARTKCKDLVVVPPNYSLYIKSHKALINLIKEYSPYVSVFSIDECFMDYTGMEQHFGPPLEAAYKIKNRIYNELGFTVNIGISINKLLAKQASELHKPNKVNTLYPNEIKEKLWPLPVEELFMVGSRTKSKLNNIGIYTIGDLANSDYELISSKLKSHGRLIYQYAWGRDDSKLNYSNYIPFKSVGNGSTIPFDIEDRETAHKILLSLVETTTRRLRQANMQCRVITIGIKTSEFHRFTHQKKILSFTNSTVEIYEITKALFDEVWDGAPIRKFSVRLSELTSCNINQLTFFDNQNKIKLEKIDKTIDSIRDKYGDKAIIRATFLHSGLKPMLGGFGAEDYPVMTSIL
ncbi:DNA polymerase Y family protein [Caldisalinibacter kiritimatiensis]|uniref:DNA polymerase IV n=1 Tax=Caldisalinibacter kiritimatiensis TaxID=1304284 RepID=R1CSR0_9FIRM|nr:DNA polymerase IV [Caldisalinibacter kiritimatiensis]EOC99743.1 DNA polymerase IV [Caldisalinibacter kiritimatiensis]